jgi:hypothetical protein
MQEEASHRLMIAARVGVGCPHGFVVGADALTNDGERLGRRMMGKIPKTDDEMGLMRPS